MRRLRDHHRSQSTLSFNATPMIDVIFLLTVFFMLVTRFSSAEQVAMDLPKPEHSQAEIVKMPKRVTINCRPSGPAGAVEYSIGPNRPEPLSVIAERLAAMRRDTSNLKVVVRADKRLRYADARAVMRILADQGIEMLSVVAHVAEKE